MAVYQTHVARAASCNRRPTAQKLTDDISSRESAATAEFLYSNVSWTRGVSPIAAAASTVRFTKLHGTTSTHFTTNVLSFS